ncbi:MAG TPA: hypothetical protein VIQ30_19215, partial [Pseudonocardia sp.]
MTNVPAAPEVAQHKQTAGPAIVAAHQHAGGWKGGPGECGVQCACGLTFDGFDSIREAAKLLGDHIA